MEKFAKKICKAKINPKLSEFPICDKAQVKPNF